MSCFRPIQAEVSPGGDIRLWTRGDGSPLELPCGKCIGCKKDRRRAWSVRITHEAQLWSSNWFATFTYDDVHLPGSLSLAYGDYQNFMKRLRKKFKGLEAGPSGKYPIRFFVAGEYGGKTCRPHYHAVLFNLLLPDAVKHGDYWYSEVLERTWENGNVLLGTVSAASASYVAGYAMKKIHGADARAHYEDVVHVKTGELTSRRPEFIVMSRRPGIGAWWYEKYEGDLFPGDRAVMEGKTWKVPRYYWEKFKREADPAIVEQVEQLRYLKAAENLEDSTAERRAVREEFAKRWEDHLGERGL